MLDTSWKNDEKEQIKNLLRIILSSILFNS